MVPPAYEEAYLLRQEDAKGRFGVVITGVQRERLLDVGGAKA
jgi:hypothetical protein